MNTPKRKNLRLPEYDYSQNGVYFLTVCTRDKQKLLWYDNTYPVGANSVRPADIMLSAYGKIVKNAIQMIQPTYGVAVKLDKYVIMPNHIHMLIAIDDCGRTLFAPTISRIVKQFKGAVTKQIGKSIWQRSFYDHIIRDEQDYVEKWNYIENNPARWLDDDLYVK